MYIINYKNKVEYIKLNFHKRYKSIHKKMYVDKIDDSLNIVHPDFGEKTKEFTYPSDNKEGIRSITVFADSNVIVIRYIDGGLLLLNFRTIYTYKGKVVGERDVYPLSGKAYGVGRMDMRSGGRIFNTSRMHFDSFSGVLVFDNTDRDKLYAVGPC